MCCNHSNIIYEHHRNDPDHEQQSVTPLTSISSLHFELVQVDLVRAIQAISWCADHSYSFHTCRWCSSNHKTTTGSIKIQNSILTFTGKNTKSILIILWFFLKKLLAKLFLHLTRSITLNKIKESWNIHHLIWKIRFRVLSIFQKSNRVRLNINAINKYHHVRNEKSSKFGFYFIQFHGETKIVAWVEESGNQNTKNTVRACSSFSNIWMFQSHINTCSSPLNNQTRLVQW